MNFIESRVMSIHKSNYDIDVKEWQMIERLGELIYEELWRYPFLQFTKFPDLFRSCRCEATMQKLLNQFFAWTEQPEIEILFAEIPEPRKFGEEKAAEEQKRKEARHEVSIGDKVLLLSDEELKLYRLYRSHKNAAKCLLDTLTGMCLDSKELEELNKKDELSDPKIGLNNDELVSDPEIELNDDDELVF